MSLEIAWKQNILVTDFQLLKSLTVVLGFGSQAFICGFSRQNICSVMFLVSFFSQCTIAKIVQSRDVQSYEKRAAEPVQQLCKIQARTPWLPSWHAQHSATGSWDFYMTQPAWQLHTAWLCCCYYIISLTCLCSKKISVQNIKSTQQSKAKLF